MRSQRPVQVLWILAAMALAATAPVVYAGLRNAALGNGAAAAGRHRDAARFYEAAARQLIWRADLWEQAGISASLDGDQENAIRLLEVARREGSLSAPGWDALGSALWGNGDRPSALAAWQAGLEAHPGTASLLDRLIAANDLEGDYAAEEAALTARLAIGNDAAAHYRLGLILMSSDPARSGNELSAAAALDREFEPAVATLRAALRAASAESAAADRLVVIGRGLGLVEEWGLAARAFAEAVAVDSQNAEAWAWLGEASQHNGRDGRPALDEALRLDPSDAVVHGLRGLYWKRQGDYSAALEEQVAAAQLRPDNAALQSAVGEAYAATGDLVSALAAYQKATVLAPADATSWRLLAAFCANNGVQVLQIGLPAARKAAELAPHDPQALDVLGWSFAQTGDLPNAEKTLLQAIQAGPEYATAHLHLAVIDLQNGDSASAFQELQTVLRLDPNGPAGAAAVQLLHQYFP